MRTPNPLVDRLDRGHAMTLAPQWTCSRCGRRERHISANGKPTPPSKWRGSFSDLVCEDCQAAGPARTQPRDEPPGWHAPVTTKWMPGREPKVGPPPRDDGKFPSSLPEGPARPQAKRKSQAELAVQRAALRAALRAAPATPDLAIARQVGADAKTVSRHRRALEKEGAIPVLRRVGRGRAA